MSQVHVITGPERRRSWTEEQKRALVAEAFAPGAVVVQVARRADVSATLLYRWRQQFGTEGNGFAEVVLARPASPRAEALESAAAIEIDFGNGRRARIPMTTRWRSPAPPTG